MTVIARDAVASDHLVYAWPFPIGPECEVSCADDEQVVMCPAWLVGDRLGPGRHRWRTPDPTRPVSRVLRADRAGRGLVRHDDDVPDPDDRAARPAARDRLAAGALRRSGAADRAVRRPAVRPRQRRHPAQRVAQRRAHARAAAHPARRDGRDAARGHRSGMLAGHRRGARRLQPDRRARCSASS